jgi:hypothetical protein
MATAAPVIAHAELETAHLFDMAVHLAPVQVIPSPAGTRFIYAAQRGTVEGERLRGEVLPGGGDWVIVGTDGIGRVDVRATIRTDDGELIFMTSTGVIHLSHEKLEALGNGAHIRWDEGYIRTSPLFETGSERYAWLNGTVTIAVNELAPNRVYYRIYRVL